MTVADFRPISLLDAAGKLLEYMVLERLLEGVYQTISTRQFGFRRGMSTMDATDHVCNLVKDAAMVINRKLQLCAVITIDIGNGFNTAPRQGIIDFLVDRGVRKDILRLIDQFHDHNLNRNNQLI
nr:unnamed protein product [Callosobruchus analis]